jgi:hypothetical protein
MKVILCLLFEVWLLPAFGKFGAALEVVSGFVTGAGAVLTPWTVAPGNSLQVRSAPFNSNIWLCGLWAMNNLTAGVLRVRSPRLHDFVQGIRQRITVNDTEPLYPDSANLGWKQRLIPQDVLTVEQSGQAANIDTGSLLIAYENLPGVAGRFIDNGLLKKAGVNIIGQELSITTAAAGGGYTGQVAINSTNDNFKANTDYALLGGIVDVRCPTLRIQGVDTGNLGVGIPGEPTQRHVTANWFQRLTEALQMPLIPVFNSANKSAILCDILSITGALTVICDLYMVELAPGMAPAAVTGS